MSSRENWVDMITRYIGGNPARPEIRQRAGPCTAMLLIDENGLPFKLMDFPHPMETVRLAVREPMPMFIAADMDPMATTPVRTLTYKRTGTVVLGIPVCSESGRLPAYLEDRSADEGIYGRGPADVAMGTDPSVMSATEILRRRDGTGGNLSYADILRGHDEIDHQLSLRQREIAARGQALSAARAERRLEDSKREGRNRQRHKEELERRINNVLAECNPDPDFPMYDPH